MTHLELMKAIATKLDLKPEEVTILWRETNNILVKQLVQHDKIRIKNFGAFVVVKHKSRTVPDPREMTKKLVIFDQFLPKFRPSEQLRMLVKDIVPTAVLPDEAGGEETEATQNPAVSPSTPQPTQQSPQSPGASITRPPNQATSPELTPTTSPQADSTAATSLANISYIDLSDLAIDKDTLNLIPLHIAKKYQMTAVEKQGDKLIVAMIDPGDREAIDFVARQTGLTVEPRITTSTDLRHAFDQYGEINSELNQLVEDQTSAQAPTTPEETVSEEDSSAPAAKIVSGLLERAVREKASDIHIEAEEKRVIVRFRVDGLLKQILELPKTLHSSVISRLKIMSNLKIDETRLPQDGRLRLVVDHNPIDFRLSTLPTVNGEKIVMRILDKSAGVLGFSDLGLTGENLKKVEDNIAKAHGMTLVTGPTGSGKTTTLYAVLGKLMIPTVNIVTMEDPVEYRIPGINQSQVNSAIGFDFASGLRSIVRQDPDIILIGEIRDLETATMAIHAALTGHIVLSTLHTNDAAGAIPRLIDMGIEPFLITSSTNAVIAQRLIRTLCEHCKEKTELPQEAMTEIVTEIEKIPELQRPKETNYTFYTGKGCQQCNDSGFKGRMGIYEVLPASEEIKKLALKRVSSSELTDQAIKEGMITLKQDGMLKVLAGQTTLEEVWRVTKD